jgi:flagellar protein FlgJ
VDKRLRPLLWVGILAAVGYLVEKMKSAGDYRQYFVGTLRQIADKVERETGISAKLGIVQAALESNYGTSTLSKPDASLTILPGGAIGPANNIFGFKTGSAWLKAGKPYVSLPTTDYDAQGKAVKGLQPFRAYVSWEESYRDWARLMQTPMYAEDGSLEALKTGDLEAFGEALGVHYAPNQGYGARLAARATEMAGLV